jgi:hypothetical protein
MLERKESVTARGIRDADFPVKTTLSLIRPVLRS